MSNPTTPFNWQMPTNTDLVTDLPADFEVFGQAVATSMADLLGGTTGQVLSKTTNADMDFTWVSQDDSNAIQNAIVDAKGDLIAATAADTPARLAIGTNNQVLTADSTQATGMKWATPATASGFNLITRVPFSAQATADVDDVFSSTYETYQIVLEYAYSSVDSDLHMQLRYAGSNTQATGYYGKFANFANSYGNTQITNGNEAVLLTGTRTGIDQASNGTFYINNVGNGSRNPMGYAIGWGASGLAPSMGSFYQSTARVYTGFRLKNASGNISATVAVYGLAKS